MIITKTVFSIGGTGRTAVVAIDQQDQLGTAAVVVASIVVDIGYAVLDPGVRLT